MLKILFLLLLCLATVARAQTNCARPVIRLLRGTQEMPATGSALLPTVTLEVAPEAGCPDQRYRFRHAQVTLLRRGRPVLPSKLVENPSLDLQPWLNAYQSGDQLLIFIAYQNLALVAADGSVTPLLAKAVNPRSGQLDLQTDDSKGISFRWVLRKP